MQKFFVEEDVVKKIFAKLFRNRVPIAWDIVNEISGGIFVLALVVFLGNVILLFKTEGNIWNTIGYFIFVVLMGYVSLEKTVF